MNLDNSQASRDVERHRIDRALGCSRRPSAAAGKRMCATGPEFKRRLSFWRYTPVNNGHLNNL